MKSIDLYCERCGPEFWAEPINAWTNLVFFVAGAFAWRLAVSKKNFTLEISIAIALTFLVGVGSMIFHTFATSWAVWFDVVPILLLQCGLVWLYCRRVMKLSVPWVAGVLALLVGAGAAGTQVPHVLNGSLGYCPALVILAWMGIWHRRYGSTEPGILLGSAACFGVALVFRTIDMAVCPVMPVGTHFLWHLCNGGTVYLAVRCLILNLPRELASTHGGTS